MRVTSFFVVVRDEKKMQYKIKFLAMTELGMTEFSAVMVSALVMTRWIFPLSLPEEALKLCEEILSLIRLIRGWVGGGRERGRKP